MTTSSQVYPLAAGTVHADFRKKYGIPPKGPGPHAPSDYGFPLPPAGHPQALKFAHAVLSRAHQATNFDPADVAKQVRKAKAIIAQHDKSKEAVKATPWRDVRWVDASQPNSRGGVIAAHPRKAESIKAFLARVPSAMPIEKAKKLTETERRMYAARRKRVRESATLVRPGAALHESATAQDAYREADVSDDIVRGVLLLRAGPGNLGDRHYYTAECIQTAASSGIFEGAPAYFNHPTSIEEQTRPERDVHQLAGWYSNVVAKECTDPELGKTVGLFADFHPRVGNDEVISLVRTCVEYAKLYPRKAFAGLSIYASGDGEPDTIDGEQWNRVDRITAVESVDIVTKAGAGGAIIPLKESQRMSKTKTDLSLVLDADKVKSGVTELLEKQKQTLKAKLAESGVTVTPEQDQEIDRALGIVDGGALDQVIDKATGVQDDDEEEGAPVEPAAPSAGAMTEDADIESMSPDQLKAALKTARGQLAVKESKLGETAGRLSLIERQRMAESVVAGENIPETFRPRLIDELVSRGFTKEKAMREHAQAFDKAFIRPHLDGAGALSESRTSTATGGNFNFDEEG
jgi:hypothetical protein